MIVKVKEPLPEEWPLMRRANWSSPISISRPTTSDRAVMQSGITAIAYETIHDVRGTAAAA